MTERTAKLFFLCAISCLLAGCIVRSPQPALCSTEVVSLSATFAGGRLGPCRLGADGVLEVLVLPEDDGEINPSPWYAFDIVPAAEQEPAALSDVPFRLIYPVHPHRYVPKQLALQGNSTAWQPLDARQVSSSGNGRRVTFSVDLRSGGIRIAAQELLEPAHYDAWVAQLQTVFPDLVVDVAGQSIEGREISRLQNHPNATRAIVLFGRQHPPEVSGAIAMQEFVRTLLHRTSTACAQKPDCAVLGDVNVVVVPLLNPDGVVHGHWRHNAGGVDLNRDWGPFTQPETQAMAAMLNDLDGRQQQPLMFLDFHSTQDNLFYTQSDADVTEPASFAQCWLELSRRLLPDYRFTDERRHNQGLPTAKNYLYSRYGVPAVTYEVGDETDRAATIDAARIFANVLADLLREPAKCSI